jgi:predicted flavoprotein YhiN
MIRDTLRFAVIGAGMAGILAAIRLREAGFGDVVARSGRKSGRLVDAPGRGVVGAKGKYLL